MLSSALLFQALPWYVMRLGQALVDASLKLISSFKGFKSYHSTLASQAMSFSWFAHCNSLRSVVNHQALRPSRPFIIGCYMRYTTYLLRHGVVVIALASTVCALPFPNRGSGILRRILVVRALSVSRAFEPFLLNTSQASRRMSFPLTQMHGSFGFVHGHSVTWSAVSLGALRLAVRVPTLPTRGKESCMDRAGQYHPPDTPVLRI